MVRRDGGNPPPSPHQKGPAHCRHDCGYAGKPGAADSRSRRDDGHRHDRHLGRGLHAHRKAAYGLNLTQVGDLDPGALLPALDAFFGELHALGAFEQAPVPGLVLDYVAEEKLPLAFEGVVEGVLLRDLLPAFEIVERAVHVGIPNGARGVAVVLCPAVAQTGDSGALGAIDLDGEQVVAAHADGPGRIEVGDYGTAAVFSVDLEGGVGGIVGGACVRLAGFVPAGGDVRGTQAGNGLHRSEEVVEDVAPVAEHVDDDAAAGFLAVVPGGALYGDGVALEDPVAELAAHAEDPAEKTEVHQGFQLHHAGQPELVLYHAVLDACLLGEREGFERGFEAVGDGLLAVDVLAGGDGLLDVGGAAVGGLRVEVDPIVWAGEDAIQIGGPGDTAAVGADGFELGGVAPYQNRLGHDAFAGTELDAALLHDGVDGAAQVLIQAHASGDAVHDDAYGVDGFFAHGSWVTLAVSRWAFRCTAGGLRRAARGHRRRRGAACRRVPGASGPRRRRGRSSRACAAGDRRSWSTGGRPGAGCRRPARRGGSRALRRGTFRRCLRR